MTALQNKLRASQERKPEPATIAPCLLQPWPGIVIVPVAAANDNHALESISDRLLETATQSRARRVVIDLSQTAGFAPEVAQTLMKTIQTLKLVGARTILAGAAPGVARALVETGGDLTHVRGFGTLAEAFQHALNNLHLRIVKNPSHL